MKTAGPIFKKKYVDALKILKIKINKNVIFFIKKFTGLIMKYLRLQIYINTHSAVTFSKNHDLEKSKIKSANRVKGISSLFTYSRTKVFWLKQK